MTNLSDRECGLPPVIGRDPKVLILGSFPSRMSLDQGRYYANPRNHFWAVMREILGLEGDDIDAWTESLKERHVAVWDVVSSRRFQLGSMDSDLRDVRLNDISRFLADHPAIRFIGVNGGKAWELFRALQEDLPVGISIIRLTSTSPANARYTIEEKTQKWRVILDYL